MLLYSLTISQALAVNVILFFQLGVNCLSLCRAIVCPLLGQSVHADNVECTLICISVNRTLTYTLHFVPGGFDGAADAVEFVALAEPEGGDHDGNNSEEGLP